MIRKAIKYSIPIFGNYPAICMLCLFLCCFNALFAIDRTVEGEACYCYSTSADQKYRLPLDSSSWPPYKIDVLRNFFVKSAQEGISRIVTKIDPVEYGTDYAEYTNVFSKYYNLRVVIETKYENFKWYSGPIYPSKMEALYGYEYEINKLLFDWLTANENFLLTHKKCGRFTAVAGCRSLDPKLYQEHIDRINKDRATWEKIHAEKKQEADRLFHQIAAFCMQKHTNLRTYYEHGLHELNRGRYDTSMQATKKLIERAAEANKPEYLKADSYLQLGIVCSMSLEYAKAIEVLSEALKRDPGNSEAYVQRAIAYFEVGNFDMALSDFFASGKVQINNQSSDPFKLQFALGFAKGGSVGLVVGAKELPSSLWHTVHGIGRLLWAGVTHPIDAYGDLSESVHDLITYLRAQDVATIATNMVPELRELLNQWDSLESTVKGEKAGFIIGKYGLEVMIPGATLQAIKKYQNIRRANALCTLETMAASSENKLVLEKLAQEIAQQRDQFFKTVKIAPDKQGKHVVGHKNYSPKIGDELQPSIFTYHDADSLLREYAGKGTPRAVFSHGEGYREVVDFKVCIGEFFDKETKQFLPTTRGTIQYARNGGAHIVPASPTMS